jgi:hypothetical protein
MFVPLSGLPVQYETFIMHCLRNHPLGGCPVLKCWHCHALCLSVQNLADDWDMGSHETMHMQRFAGNETMVLLESTCLGENRALLSVSRRSRVIGSRDTE